MKEPPHNPSWDRLYEIASGQEGLLTTAQAAEAGYSTALLVKYVRNGRLLHVRRGIYRLAHFPAGAHEDLVVFWLWSEQQGVFSHETALSLHQLSDVLPTRVHLTLPASWAKRRLRVPVELGLHFADLAPAERTWFEAFPVTTPLRALHECAQAYFSPELLLQARAQALTRGLVRREELGEVDRYLAPFLDGASPT
jgi:predicted transcriptional regulator of viral defense system